MKQIIYTLFIVYLSSNVSWGQVLPDGFVIETVTEEIEGMVGCTFAENGYLFIWTKDGKVWLWKEDELVDSPILDISEEVSSYSDHGLLGFALDPDFLNNGYIYTSYVVDRHYLLYFGTPEYDPNESIDGRATIARITKFQLDKDADYQSVVPNSRKVLLGKGVEDNIAILHSSHSIGALVFGDDGTLISAFGDGSTWEGVYAGGGPPYFNSDVETALQDGIIEPEEDIGSYRAQLLSFHNGKVLRMDPETGAGISSNPFYNADDPYSAQSRIWAIGVRNPYRLTLRKGSGDTNPDAGLPGTIFLGDVSNYNREELNIIPYGGVNLGWPLFEGEKTAWEFYNIPTENPLAPNPEYDGVNCTKEFLDFQDLVLNRNPAFAFHTNPCSGLKLETEHPTFFHKFPELTWKHKWSGDLAYTARYNEDGDAERVLLSDADSPVEGEMFHGIASVAGTFYTGIGFPEEYRGKYFHLDYKGWIRMCEVDINDTLKSIELFYDNDNFLVHLEEGPDGCLYLIEYPGGLRKICFGGNVSPEAAFEVDMNYGVSPLEVNFNNLSFDPNDDPLTVIWDFGDDDTSDEFSPTHLFEADSDDPQSFEVTLTVSDGNGGTAAASKIISLNNTPPTANITSISDGYRYGDKESFLLELNAISSDKESSDDELNYRWESHLHHNFHSHFDRAVNAKSGQLQLGSVGCDLPVPAVYYYRIQFTVTDPQGLSTTDTVFIYPDCDQATSFVEFTYGSLDIGEFIWTVQTNDTVVSFTVQQLSEDNVFEDVILIDGVWLANDIQQFRHEAGDIDPNGTYRIKYITHDSTFGYSWEINPNINEGLKILGNPTSGELNFSLPSFEPNLSIKIFNYLGQKVYDGEIQDGVVRDHKINIEKLYPGTYILSIKTESGEYSTKFVKI